MIACQPTGLSFVGKTGGGPVFLLAFSGRIWYNKYIKSR